MITELREINKEMQRQNEIKNEEIRILIVKMEGYKKGKDQEIAKLKMKLKSTEDDIKVLVVEHEKQKRQANEKIKMLQDIFNSH